MTSSRFVIVLAVIAVFSFTEARTHASAPNCGDGPCHGPVEVQYAGYNCEGTPTAYIQLLPPMLASSKQGKCVDDNSTWLTSSAWMCDPGHNFASSKDSKNPLFPHIVPKRDAAWKARGVYRLLTWKTPGCPELPPITKERPVGQCYNGNGYSFGFACDTLPVKWVQPDAIGIQHSGPSIGKPNVPCPDNKCPSKVPYISYHKSSTCSDTPTEAPEKSPTAIYANSELDTCYTRYNETATSFAYSINMWCDVQGEDSTLQIDLRTVGCASATLPFQTIMHDEKIAGKRECFPDKASGLYFRYHCMEL